MSDNVLQYRSEPALAGPSPRDLRLVYAVEFISCLGTNLLLLGVYFYTHARLGWTLRQNFLLAAGQGLVGAIGALLASPISERFSRRGALIGIYSVLSVVAVVALLAKSAPLITALLLVYTVLVGTNWPMLESIVSTGAEGHELSRRIGVYNLLWSAAAALIIAANGALIDHAPWAVFVIPIIVHALCAVLISRIREPAHEPGGGHATVEAAPELLAVRRLALALSRVSLPATYVVIYSLMAMLPSLPVVKILPAAIATLLSSTWMASRWVTFLVLGATTWWHARPRLLLASAVLMVPAFLGIVLPGSRTLFWHTTPDATILAWMIAGQLLLGVCVGVIYSGSLYFGMALSEGSTEHGGYHEALINFGSAVGPIAGVAAEAWRPGDIRVSVTAVTGVIALSVVATVLTAAAAGRKSAADRP
jgi:MFS family permease